MAIDASRRLIVALDFDSLRPAYALARRLAGCAGMFKVGMELFTAEGPRAVEKLASLGAGIFLDLKFHDIPSSVAGALRAVAGLAGVRLVNVHAFGGVEMMRAARQAIAAQPNRPKLLGVTLLTSLNRVALAQIGIPGKPAGQAVKLAKLAQQAGLDGVVASAHEARAIRRTCGKKFLIVVPGVRPAGHGAAPKKNDQGRVATPAEAIHAGADYLVVGRPITQAKDPIAVAQEIVKEITEVIG